MQSTYKGKVLAFVALASIATIANAQQPGSVEYNTVFLPAHGVGDTVRASPRDRWGRLLPATVRFSDLSLALKERPRQRMWRWRIARPTAERIAK